MAASPASVVSTPIAPVIRRGQITLTHRRLEANRRNATHSSGPRTPEGKARVARNAVKHGFFVAPEKWTPAQLRDFLATRDGLCDDLKPQGMLEESCVATMALSYVRMAAMLRYENIAALKYHQQQDRELEERIATADATQASRLRAGREKLRRAGLWRPTIPGPREARAIIRYSGSLDRAIRRAGADLEGLKALRKGGTASISKVQKQTHYSASADSDHAAAEGLGIRTSAGTKVQKQTHYEASGSKPENAKTNPLSSMVMGNRHQRRRARALAARPRHSHT